MYASTWKIITAINTVGDEYIVMGYDPNSPTPWATWTGYIKDGLYDFNWGTYFKSKKEAWNNLIERAERFYQ